MLARALDEWENQHGIRILDLEANFLLAPLESVYTCVKQFVIKELEKANDKFSKTSKSILEEVNKL